MLNVIGGVFGAVLSPLTFVSELINGQLLPQNLKQMLTQAWKAFTISPSGADSMIEGAREANKAAPRLRGAKGEFLD